MRIQNFLIKSMVSKKQEKIVESFELQRESRHSRSEVCTHFGMVKGIFFWFFIMAGVIVGSFVVSTEKTVANDVAGGYQQYHTLLPPNPREEFAMKDVFFDFNSFNIKDSARAVLKENAEVLKSNPDVMVFIHGYCDARENTDENLGLKRADAINDFIVHQGVEPERVTSVDKCNESYVSLTTDEISWRLDRKVHLIPFRVKETALNVAVQ